MKRPWFQSIVILGTIAILSFPAHAADTPKFSAKVSVSVYGEESIKNSVSSFLIRELRSLGDVEIVDNNHGWELQVVAIETVNAVGNKTGFVLSTLIIVPFHNKEMRELFKPEDQDFGIEITSGLIKYPKQHWISLGGLKDLQDRCKRIIADFDSKCLEEIVRPSDVFLNPLVNSNRIPSNPPRLS